MSKRSSREPPLEGSLKKQKPSPPTQKRTGLPLPETVYHFEFSAKAVPKYDKDGRVGEYSVEECLAICEELNCGREGIWWSMDALSHKFLYEEVFRCFSLETDNLSFTLHVEFDDRIEQTKYNFEMGKEFWKKMEGLHQDKEWLYAFDNHMITLREVTVRGLDGSVYALDKNFTLDGHDNTHVELISEVDEDSKES